MIQMHGISKVYPNGTTALSDINLKIGKGEFVFVVGSSGAGKSTLLKLISRQVIPSKGQIVVDGKSIIRLNSNEVAHLRRRVGVVFQDFKLLPNKTVFENVAFALEVIEASRRQIRTRVPNVLELVGLADKANFFPSQLSGGEQQRASIARGIVNDPVVLLADEPTGNLDPETTSGIMELLSRINQRETTIMMATHNKPIVDGMKKRVVAIENGRIIRDEQGGTY